MHQENPTWSSHINHWYEYDAASHGLICYTNEDLVYQGHIYFWNPAIRKLQILPNPPRNPGGIVWITLDFGFCEKN